MAIISCVKKADIVLQDMGGGLAKGALLPGMMEGVETYKCVLRAGSRISPEKFSDKTQAFFFIKGTGYIATAKKAFSLTESAVFVPRFADEDYFFQAETDLEYLQCVSALTDHDRESIAKFHVKLPYFNSAGSWYQYVEGFRDEELRSLSVLDHRFIGRMSMGYVVGDGGAGLEPHTHDNLYQWFYGMEGTNFRFRAEEEEIQVAEGDWVCIPNGISHIVLAKPGECINYMWFEMVVPGMEQENS